MNKLAVSLFVSSFIAASASFGQAVNFIIVQREAVYLQTGPETIALSPWEANGSYKFFASIINEDGSFTNAKVSHNGTTLDLLLTEDGWEAEESFNTLQEMNAMVTAGTYTFTGTGSTAGAFTVPVDYTPKALPAAKKVTNFNSLQSVDPSKPVTVSFEAFNDYGVDRIIDMEVSYWNGQQSVELWKSPEERDDGLPGIIPSKTSITIPADTLVGSTNNNMYDVTIFFSSIDTMVDAPEPFASASKGTVSSVTTQLQITANPQTQTWAGHPYATSDGWVNTNKFMGWINVESAPYVWSSALNKFIYLPEANVGQFGAWSYVPK